MQRECGPMKPQKKQQQMRCRSSTDGQQNTETILFQQYQEDQDSLLPLRTKKNVKPSEQPSIKNLLLSLPPIEADLSCKQDNKILFKEVTYTEVQKALSSSSSNTAAGASQINYTILKWAWPHVGNEITMIICWCLANGYHPLQWQRTIAIVLKKPNKPNYLT